MTRPADIATKLRKGRVMRLSSLTDKSLILAAPFDDQRILPNP
jgi:hypothetical protein